MINAHNTYYEYSNNSNKAVDKRLPIKTALWTIKTNECVFNRYHWRMTIQLLNDFASTR